MSIEEATVIVYGNAVSHGDRSPTLGTLLEEVAEYARSLEKKHSDHPALELIQIAGIAINMLKEYELNEVRDAVSERENREAL